MNRAELCLRLPGRLEAAVFIEANLSEVLQFLSERLHGRFLEWLRANYGGNANNSILDKQSGAQYVKTWDTSLTQHF